MPNLTGQEQVARNMKAAIERMQQGAKAGAYQAAGNIITEAKERCPVDVGTLAGSGYAGQPTIEGSILTVPMGFGGPAEDYAIVQHEKLELHHAKGEAKFLERALDSQRGDVGPLIAARIREALGGA